MARDGRALAKSAATLCIVAALDWPWRWLGIVAIVPQPLRDALYDLVARNRPRLFDKARDWLMLAPRDRSRFLDEMPGLDETSARP